MNRQARAPLFEALLNIKAKHVSLHVPGHKLGNDFDIEGLEWFLSVLSLDQTELDGLDDLHHASGVILEAEQLAAEAFGSEITKFLVGGTTVGILSLILATIREGEKCLIERNSHKSVFNALRLAHGNPVFLAPNFDSQTGIPTGIRAEQVEAALKQDSTIKAVLITNPNYYGQTTDLKAIAEITHSYRIPLLVDEAHGAHFRFSSDLPLTALEQGADGVVQSTHKTLSSMTMSSMLHLQGERIDRTRVKRWLSALQSSSPSYPLLASLDLARRHMVVGEGSNRLNHMIQCVKSMRDELSSLPWIKVAPSHDPLRVVLVLPRGCSRQLQVHLQELGIYPEIVENDRLVFVFSGGNSNEDLRRIKRALHSFKPPSIDRINGNVAIPHELWLQPIIEDLDLGEKEWCSIEDAENRIAAEMIIPYPPGIPLVLERQKIHTDVKNILLELTKAGIHLQGVEKDRILVYI